MRIAISGTHCSGKSTLIEAFLDAHPDYTHEPEPYETLVEEYGEEFSVEPCVDDFLRQLEFNAERLRQYQPGDRVIFERCPADFLAYILALKDLGRESIDAAAFETARESAAAALQHLDLIVYLPLDDANPIDLPDDEDPELREAMDHELPSIWGADQLEAPGGPKLIEVTGSTAQRLRSIGAMLDS
jgi:hypothetical protein